MRKIVTKRKMLLFPNIKVGSMWAGYELERGVIVEKADNMVVIMKIVDERGNVEKTLPFFCANIHKTSDEFLDEIERLNGVTNS
jgi:hypothetical protein